jgi:transposase-like protein
MRELSQSRQAKRVQVLAQLQLNNGNIARTARETGVTRATIRYWRNANQTAAEKLEREKQREQKQQEVIAADVEKVVSLSQSKLEDLAGELVDSLLGDLQNPRLKFSFRDRAWAFGVIFDKLQIQKGLPTAINKTIGSLSKEERAERARELLLRGRQRRLNKGGVPMEIVANDD